MIAARRLNLFWNTARHLSARQVTTRIRLRSAEAWRDASPELSSWFYDRLARKHPAQCLPQQVWRNASTVRRKLDPTQTEELGRRAAAVRKGEFSFVGHPASLGTPIDWRAPRQSRLWRYHLHQFDYLIPISLVDDDEGAAVRSLVDEWIAANPIGGATSRDAWHPFVVSVRLVNWMIALAAVDHSLTDTIAHSLSRHALFVRRNLEHDVGGNHLLKNLKAVVFAAVLAGERQAMDDAARAFADELARQLLSDGCHFERTPMYHALVLTDALEVRAILGCVGVTAPEVLSDAIARMRAFLHTITHPDGQLALFKDTALEGACAPADIHGFAEALEGSTGNVVSNRHQLLLPAVTKRTASRPDSTVSKSHGEPSGYFKFESTSPALWLLCDAGAVCPDQLPAHAHADMFSYECDLRGTRLIVDSGVGEYQQGAWRQYYRSTRAHNTVVVDGVDQSECWESFRVARRANPTNVRYHSSVGVEGLDLTHDGYGRLTDPVRHRRRIALVRGMYVLIVDELLGTGNHAWSNHIHGHSQAELRLVGPQAAWLERSNAALAIAWTGPVEPEIVKGGTQPLAGWRAENFGVAAAAPTLCLKGSGTAPMQMAYVLVPSSRPLHTAVRIADRNQFAITHGSEQLSVFLGDSAWTVTGRRTPSENVDGQ